MSIRLRRRDFIAGLGGSAAWPLAARAQQGGRVRRIGVLIGLDEIDPGAKARLSAFTQTLADLGWNGRNVRMGFPEADVGVVRDNARQLKFKAESTGFED